MRFRHLIGYGLVIFLLAVGVYWGYRETQEKNALLIRAENQYQRAFADLVYNVDQLHREIGKSLALNGAGQVAPTMATISRLSYNAQNAAGQLPLSLMSLTETEQFLSRIGDFSYQMLRRDLHANPPTEAERKTFRELYRASGDVRDTLRKMQEDIYTQKLRWMDVEQALAQSEIQADQGIIDGIQEVSKRIEGYAEIDYGNLPQTSEALRIMRLRSLGEPTIDEAKAKEIALRAVGVKQAERIDVVPIEDEGMHLYDVTIDRSFSDDQDGARYTVEIARSDGRILWWLNARPVDKARYSVEQGYVRALRALKSRNYPPLENVKTERHGASAVYTFVPVQQGILLYPDHLLVSVALDKGEVIGVNQTDFLLFHRERKLSRPVLGEAEARSKLSPQFKVEKTRLALIINDQNEEVLTYEFTGTLYDLPYRIYLNAATGMEEKVEMLDYAKEQEKSATTLRPML
ncbi:MAG: germination protein YpeB [Candidatus Carbobacillus altaicus]|nr:germination protein YpeB [Candidatus Carbobacillus altaicus]